MSVHWFLIQTKAFLLPDPFDSPVIHHSRPPPPRLRPSKAAVVFVVVSICCSQLPPTLLRACSLPCTMRLKRCPGVKCPSHPMLSEHNKVGTWTNDSRKDRGGVKYQFVFWPVSGEGEGLPSAQTGSCIECWAMAESFSLIGSIQYPSSSLMECKEKSI